MEEEEETEENLPELRSMNCDIPCYVLFEARTTRRVDLFWIDYEGKRVKYSTLEPGEKYEITTYETHPWLFRDADSGLPLEGNGQELYMPEQNLDDYVRFLIAIRIPVFRLIDRCLEEFGHFVGDGDVKDLELPLCLKMDLLMHQMNKNIPYSVYDPEEE